MKMQYNAIKAEHPDCLLFYRLGDFYEMFDDDAVLGARELNLALTTRDRGKPEDERTPMCGVPYHSAEQYISKLIAKGYKVAVCEQMEDPKLCKGLVSRDIVRIISPGTIMETSMLREGESNYLGAVMLRGKAGGCGGCGGGGLSPLPMLADKAGKGGILPGGCAGRDPAAALCPHRAAESKIYPPWGRCGSATTA